MDELLSVLDWETGQPTGEVVPRKLAHALGKPHKALHLWVLFRHQGQACLLLQQRSWAKPNYPGIFVASVGGHVVHGEGLEGLVREAAEEIGFPLDLTQVEYLESHPFTLLLPGYQDYEWIDEYLVRSPWGLTDFTFPDAEVIGFAALPLAGLAALVANPQGSSQGWFYDGSRVTPRSFSAPDFIPGFWQMSIAQRLAGLKP